jgi:hypothetical protein
MAAYALLAILERSGNSYIAYVGNIFTRIGSRLVICAAIAIIMTYIIFIRQSLMVMGYFGVAVIEWAALCVGILLIFIRLRSMMPVDGSQLFGNEEKVAKSLHYDTGELKAATAKVEEFVNGGKKEGLITLMASALIGNGVPADTVSSVIAVIVDHEDEKEPPAMLKWAVGNIYDANRKKRLKAVNEMMAAAVSAADSVGATSNKNKV